MDAGSQPARDIHIVDDALISSRPLVSVGMLAYRHSDYIAQAIESVVSQSCDFPFELIIGEDNSPDGTLEVAKTYQRRYPHIIRIVTGETNVGMNANSLRCQAVARGTYMTYCEGDDYWSDASKLARQVGMFQKHPGCSMVFHSASTLDSRTGKLERASTWSPHSRFLSTRELVLGDGGLVPTASIMVHRERVLKHMPEWAAQAVAPDYALTLWATCVGNVAFISRAMSVYRINVAESWSVRHVPRLDHRMNHARGIELMFAGFLGSSGYKNNRDVARMVSKYYSDAIVRTVSEPKDAMIAYREARERLVGSDRALAFLAARYGIRLPMFKTILRRLSTLSRVARAAFTRRLAA